MTMPKTAETIATHTLIVLSASAITVRDATQPESPLVPTRGPQPKDLPTVVDPTYAATALFVGGIHAQVLRLRVEEVMKRCGRHDGVERGLSIPQLNGDRVDARVGEANHDPRWQGAVALD